LRGGVAECSAWLLCFPIYSNLIAAEMLVFAVFLSL
jgi:hypothetical protein